VKARAEPTPVDSAREDCHDVYVDAVAANPNDWDVEALGLLDGLQGQARQERAELIEWLLARGFDVEQIRGESSPMLLPAIRITGDDGKVVSSREVSQSNGVSLELLQRLHRAVGLVRADDPDARLLSRADAESVLEAARLVDLGFDADEVVLIMRLLMDGLTGAAVTLRQAALHASLHPGATELELAQAIELLARDGVPVLGPMVDALLRLAMRHSVETEAINVFERTAGSLPGARTVAVAFADLVGFTQLGEQMPPEELGMVAFRLADLAHEVVASPVQFVKTIGDAVMLVCADPFKLLLTVLDLVDAAAADDFPRLRVGLAFGQAVNRAGDWYGSPVNLASRVTGVAPANTVRVTESAREAIGDRADIEWAAPETRQFKGIRAEVLLYGARRRYPAHERSEFSNPMGLGEYEILPGSANAVESWPPHEAPRTARSQSV
jgi:adenylate cyclase